MSQWIGAFLPAFFGAVLSSLGMGGGGVLLIYLTVVTGMSQLQAQGINLVFFIPVAAVALIIHAKNRLIDFKSALLLIPTGLLGAWGGWALAGRIPEALLSKLFAGLLLIIGINEIVSAIRMKKK